MITWFGNSPLDGTCSLYPTNITLNTLSGVPLCSCYKVQVGVDEKKNIVIRPLSKDQVERGDIPEETIFPYQLFQDLLFQADEEHCGKPLPDSCKGPPEV